MKIKKYNTNNNILIWTIKNRFFILISILLSTAAGIIYSFISQPKYQRELSVMMLSDIYGNSQINELITFSYWDINKTGIDVFNEIEVFRSPMLMEKVVNKLNLNVTYKRQNITGNVDLYKKTPIVVEFIKPIEDYNGERVSSISFNIGKKNRDICLIENIRINGVFFKKKLEIRTGQITESPFGVIKISPTNDFSIYENKNIKIEYSPTEKVANSLCGRLFAKLKNPSSTVINLSITDTNPQRAEDILNTLLSVYNDEWINYIKESHDKTAQFIEAQLNKLESELLLDSNIDLPQKSKTIPYQDRTDSEALFRVNNHLLVAKYTKEYIKGQKKTDNPIPTNLGLQNDSLSELINEYNAIITTKKHITSSNNENKAILHDLNNKLVNKKTEILYTIDNLIETLSLQVKTIEKNEDELASIFSSDNKEVKEVISLEREDQTKKEFYNYLLRKLEENEHSSSLIVSNTRLLKPATGKDEPIFPKKGHIIMLAFLFGIAFPYGYKFLSDVLTKN